MAVTTMTDANRQAKQKEQTLGVTSGGARVEDLTRQQNDVQLMQNSAGSVPATPVAPVASVAGQPAGCASVAFTAPASDGAIAYYEMTTPGGFTATGIRSSPFVAQGLQPGPTTFRVRAISCYGTSADSPASNSVVVT